MGKKLWTEEKCIERALKFKHVSDWRDGDFDSYMAAIGLKCYKACTKHMTRKYKYEISELQESIKEYSSYHDFKKYEPEKCKYILNKYSGISFFFGFPDFPRFYSFHEILGYAYACESRKEFKSKHPNLYGQARVKGWKDIIFKMCDYKDIDDSRDSYLPAGSLTRERCRLVALHYDRRGDFAKNAASVYGFARNQGKQFLDEICSHMVKYTWTKKRILESLDGFSDFELWSNQHPSAYDVALNKGLIEKIKVILNN